MGHCLFLSKVAPYETAAPQEKAPRRWVRFPETITVRADRERIRRDGKRPSMSVSNEGLSSSSSHRVEAQRLGSSIERENRVVESQVETRPQTCREKSPAESGQHTRKSVNAAKLSDYLRTEARLS